jgi:hypothetical protein
MNDETLSALAAVLAGWGVLGQVFVWAWIRRHTRRHAQSDAIRRIDGE